jgi:hypothetical protein
MTLALTECYGEDLAGDDWDRAQMRLTELSPAALSRHITRMRHLGLVRRIGGTYRHYLTQVGRAAIAGCCHLTENVFTPALA